MSDARASTPCRQTPESSDSEDESICSASDDGAAARLERLFGAAHRENRTMPPPLPPASRDPRIAAAAGLGNRAEVPKNLPERNRSSLSPASTHSLPSPVFAPGGGAPRDPEPVAQGEPSTSNAVSDRSSLFYIPEELRGVIRIEPTSSRMVQDEREREEVGGGPPSQA